MTTNAPAAAKLVHRPAQFSNASIRPRQNNISMVVKNAAGDRERSAWGGIFRVSCGLLHSAARPAVVVYLETKLRQPNHAARLFFNMPLDSQVGHDLAHHAAIH